jgi:hypothetical protein
MNLEVLKLLGRSRKFALMIGGTVANVLIALLTTFVAPHFPEIDSVRTELMAATTLLVAFLIYSIAYEDAHAVPAEILEDLENGLEPE